MAHACLNSLGQRAVQLVIAMHGDALGWKTRAQCHVQLTIGGDVKAQSLARHPSGNAHGKERFGRVMNMPGAVESIGHGPASSTKIVLIHDHEWGSVLISQVDQANTGNRHLAIVVAMCVHGPHMRRQGIELIG